MIIILLPVLGEPSAIKGNLWGNIIIFTAMLSWAAYTVFSKKFHTRYSPIYLNTCFILTAAVIQFFPALSEFSSDNVWWQHVSANSIFAVFYVSALGTVATYIFYQYAIKHGTPIIASMSLYIQPIATFSLASIILGEILTLGFIIGSILIFFGTWRVTKGSKSSAIATNTK